MKKYSLILSACLFVIALNSTSCRSCKGGGWYGDRNLGFTPTKEKPADLISPATCEELTICEISTP